LRPLWEKADSASGSILKPDRETTVLISLACRHWRHDDPVADHYVADKARRAPVSRTDGSSGIRLTGWLTLKLEGCEKAKVALATRAGPLTLMQADQDVASISGSLGYERFRLRTGDLG
jgi:hypothetical protein